MEITNADFAPLSSHSVSVCPRFDVDFEKIFFNVLFAHFVPGFKLKMLDCEMIGTKAVATMLPQFPDCTA